MNFFRKAEQFYETLINCNNCGRTEMYEIKKGVKIEEYFKKNKCSICGCNIR